MRYEAEAFGWGIGHTVKVAVNFLGCFVTELVAELLRAPLGSGGAKVGMAAFEPNSDATGEWEVHRYT